MNIKNNLNTTSLILKNITDQINDFDKENESKFGNYSLEKAADYSYDQIKKMIGAKIKTDSVYLNILINNIKPLKYSTRNLIEKFRKTSHIIEQNEEFLNFCRKFVGSTLSFDVVALVGMESKMDKVYVKFKHYLNKIYGYEKGNDMLNIESTVEPYENYKEYYEFMSDFFIKSYYNEYYKFQIRNDIIKDMIKDMSKKYDSDINVFLGKQSLDNRVLSFFLGRTNAEKEILNRLKRATEKDNERMNLNEIKNEIKQDIFKEKSIWHKDYLYKEIYKLDTAFMECIKLSEDIKYLKEKYVMCGDIDRFIEHIEKMAIKEEEFFNYYEKTKKILEEIKEKDLSFKELNKDEQLDFLNLNILEKRIVKLKEIRKSFESKLMIEMFYEFYKNILEAINYINKNGNDFKKQMYKYFNVPKIGLNVLDRCGDFAIKYFNILNISDKYNEKILTIRKNLDDKIEKIISQEEKKELEILQQNTIDFKLYFFENLAKKEIELYRNILEYYKQKHIKNELDIDSFSSFIKNCKEYINKIKKIINIEKNSVNFINIINEFNDLILKSEDILKKTTLAKKENLTNDIEKKNDV